MTSAGAMREVIRLQEREEFDDGAGNTYGEWVDRATVPARIRSLKGSETVLAGRLQGVQPIVVTIRNGGDAAVVNTEWRAVNDRTGEPYNIRSIIRDERGAWIDLLVEAGVAT
jgi:SPP1 family predicted phage head-tail adaptor